MTIREVAIAGKPILKKICKPVENPTSAEILRLVQDMKETMLKYKAIGISAPQVFVSKRILIFMHIEQNDSEEYIKTDRLQVLINPVIEPIDDEKITEMEGCISIPDTRIEISRYKQISYSGIDENGIHISDIANGYTARIIQHEMDHLNGILMIDHMTSDHRISLKDS
jgi:peptide deformylase